MKEQSASNSLIGKTLARVENREDREVYLTTTTGERYRMAHSQDCCESVSISEIIGNLDDLIGDPLLLAEEVSSEGEPPPPGEYTPESYTWTFYRFSTVKADVTIRWLGESNGYYSESVDFEEVKE